jgi:thiamine biosynthesis lipoprotein
MKRTELIMGMPITVEMVDHRAGEHFQTIFDYFHDVDARYSTYKETSEISQINQGLPEFRWSEEMKAVLALCEDTKQHTKGYFDIVHRGKRDPSGLVKGWAINNAAKRLRAAGVKNFYIEAGGDIQVDGHNRDEGRWSVGIRNPFNMDQVVKTVHLTTEGVATSGTYIRGQHIYNPHEPDELMYDVQSLTVIGSNIYEADRFATAAFAMGLRGIEFIAATPGLEGYMIDKDQTATYTTGFERYTKQ